ncbi:hypothetical protein CDL12_26793 [Handroanthus impetiginosus]|uniref:PGG domain-containing protein n=1 Tax=Handroanthus impetiginosus TaxID=429701 RepID=A0A2G9G6E3_9LAMI|nr:hypothetical protein CDL12_26793 [Handroanthus impetiginosus]
MITHYDVSSAAIKARNRFDAFHIAAKLGHLEVLKVLMEAMPQLLETVDYSNATPLHTAAAQGHVEVVSFLLERNSNLARIARINGKMVLHTSARYGHFEVVTQQGIATWRDKKGQTALQMAVKGQNTKMLDELIASDSALLTMLKLLMNYSLNLQIVQTILKHKGINKEAINKSGETAFDTAEKTDSIRYNRKGLNDTTTSTTVVTVLIATIAFPAISTPLGQYVNDPENVPPGFSPGEAHIAPNIEFTIFLIFDALALFILLTVVEVRTSVVVLGRKAKKQMMAVINKLCGWVACLCQLCFFHYVTSL